jgi:hypothetical protein
LVHCQFCQWPVWAFKRYFLRRLAEVGKWLTQFKEKNIPDMPTIGTDKADTGSTKDVSTTLCYSYSDSQPLSLTDVDVDELSRARTQLREQGYFLMQSLAVGDLVAVVEAEADRKLVPEGILVYTFQELRLMNLIDVPMDQMILAWLPSLAHQIDSRRPDLDDIEPDQELTGKLLKCYRDYWLSATRDKLPVS